MSKILQFAHKMNTYSGYAEIVKFVLSLLVRTVNLEGKMEAIQKLKKLTTIFIPMNYFQSLPHEDNQIKISRFHTC